MAIIYTYPRLNNPDGTELVVVSETKNQNATRVLALSDIASLVPSTAGGTVTSITLDFNSALVPVPTDTGLRVWDPSVGAFRERLTITTNGSFDIGGILNINNGGTGLQISDYATGDMLYFDPSKAELQTVPIGAASTVLTVDPGTGFPVWSPASAGAMSSWTIDGNGLGTTAQVISDGDVVTLIGGTVIETVAATGITPQVTINHDAVSYTQTPTGPTVLAHGGNFTAINSLTVSAEGHLTAADLQTYTLPAAGGSTGHGFSPCPVAISDRAINMSNTYHYLTVAEHTMIITEFMVWGNPAPTLSSDVEFALYRGGTGPTTWSAATLVATGTIPGAQEGSNIGTLSGPVSVTVGENLIVGLRRTSGDWDTVGDNGTPAFGFGVANAGSIPFVALPPQTGIVGEGAERFALTLL